MNDEIDVMRRLVDYHDHISAPSVLVADDLHRGRRRVRRKRALLAGGVALGLASVIAAVSLFTGELAADRPQPAGPPGLTTTFVSPSAPPRLTTTFVSPTYGYSFGHRGRWLLAPAKELWDPGDEQRDSIQFSDRFDGVETGETAYFVGASTEIPDGVSIDEWYDEYVSPSGCGVPRSQQPEITIDGQLGRIAECRSQTEATVSQIEATVVAGGRLYLFMLGHQRSDARAFFDAWIATIDLTPETAAVRPRPSPGPVGNRPNVFSQRKRAVLVLRYFDDLTEADTAAALDISVGTVKLHVRDALARLRDKQSDDERTGAAT